MPQIGPLEILIVSVLALIVFGPQKLPDLARSAGKGLSQMRSMAEQIKADFENGFDETESEREGSGPGEDSNVVEGSKGNQTQEPVAS